MKPVYMYTLSTCPWCIRKIMRELEAAGVAGFPYVRIGDDVVQGYKPARFRELLGIATVGGETSAPSNAASKPGA